MRKTVKYLDQVVYWTIVLIPFSIAIAPAITYTLMGFLALSFILNKIIKREKFFSNSPISLPFIFLVVVSVVSFKNSVDYRASFRGITKLIESALIFLICANQIKSRRHINHIVLSIIFGAVLVSVDAIWQVSFGWDFIRGKAPILNIGLKRATAAFPDANVLGVYLSAVAPLIIGLALFYFKGKKRLLMFLASGLAVAGITLTFARGTALALYLSILLISICRKSKIITIILLAILLVSPLLMPQSIKDWAKSVNYNPLFFMFNADRISIYKNTVNMVKHHPIVGVGVNTYSKNYLKYKLAEPEDARTGDSMYAHNHFLQMAGEIGLAGLFVFFWLLFRLFRKNISIYRNLKDEYYKVLSLSILACLFAFLVNGLTETSLYYPRVAMIFWYLIGFSFALEKFTHANKT